MLKEDISWVIFKLNSFMKVDFSKVKYDNPCLSCSHTDIMYCHNCIHYLGRYRKKV